MKLRILIIILVLVCGFAAYLFFNRWVRYYPVRRIAVGLQLYTSDDGLIKKSVRDLLNDLASTLSR